MHHGHRSRDEMQSFVALADLDVTLGCTVPVSREEIMKFHPIAFAKRFIVLALAVSCPAFGSIARAQEKVADFSAGPGNGVYSFASKTPKTLGDLLKGAPQAELVDIHGYLFLPPGSEKVPAVVLMHGSGGFYYAMQDFWPKQFNAAGIAVLSVDSFKPRGVKSTAEDQSLVPYAADLTDAFAALKIMASHPRIDAGRIAIMGFSRGGATAWRTAVERIIASQKLPSGLRFAAHVPTYAAGCAGTLRLMVKPGVFSHAPMLWVHGDADDYVPIGPCKEYSERIGKAGTPVEFFTIPGARHKFDEDDQKYYKLREVQTAKEDCPLEMDVATLGFYDRFTGEKLSPEGFQATLKKSCVGLGASVEGSRSARDKAAQAAVAFLGKVFAR
jgi:dienelactone hydrolase